MSKVVSLKMTFVAAVAAAMVALLAVSAGVGTAWADGQGINVSELKTTSTQKMVYYPSNEDGNAWTLYGNAAGKKFQSVKSSDKTTVSANYFQGKKEYVQVTLKKAGKANLTFKYNGKNYKINFVIVKYTNPVKTFKVGSVNYASKFKKVPYCFAGKALAGKNLTVKASSAWKFVRFEYENTKTWKIKKVKSLKKFPDVGYVTVVLKHKKTGALQSISLMGDAY